MPVICQALFKADKASALLEFTLSWRRQVTNKQTSK